MPALGALRRSLRLLLLRGVGALTRRSRAAHSREVRRVLVIKPDHLGDVLLLTPALRLLRQQRPELEIALLIGPWSKVAVAHNPDIDTLLLCEFPGFTRASKPGFLQPYRLLLKTALLLRAGRYDAALIARDDHWWGALLAALAGIPQRIGFAVAETAPFLTTALPHSFDEHVTHQNLELVEALTGQPDTTQPLMVAPIGEQDRAWAADWLARHEIIDQTTLVAIHPGSGGEAKLWLASRWAEIANALHEQRVTVVLTGGPDEHELVASIVQAMRHQPLTMVGEATLGQLAALYARCALVLGVDSGPLHLAVSTGVPTLALFGPGDDKRFGPWGDAQRHVVLRSGLWCSPCGVLHACPRGTAPSECMAQIPTAQLLPAIDALLE
ncbi:MAG TPA: glycosyltransferase family 9 protein [Herpetosiphonaceae bacterium]